MRFLDAGESHGRMLTAIVEGLPSNIEIDKAFIDYELSKRQQGFGRGGRMKIENDTVDIVSGVIRGRTTGAPITLILHNKDYVNWKKVFDENITEKVLIPRPGHADLDGILKYNLDDIRAVIERSSARETAIRTAVGALASMMLKNLGIRVSSRVLQVGKAVDEIDAESADFDYAEKSELMCSNTEVEEKVLDEIKSVMEKGDTLGGKFEVVIKNVPPGLGSYVQWDRRLDSRLAGAVMGIQGIKAVEIGNAFSSLEHTGSSFHDEICYSRERGYFRKTNNSGGIEGGVSNGEDIIIHAVMKPIPTLKMPLSSVNIETKEEVDAAYERSDTCAVASAGIVARNVCMWEIACAVIEKFGGDCIEELLSNYSDYMKSVENR